MRALLLASAISAGCTPSDEITLGSTGPAEQLTWEGEVTVDAPLEIGAGQVVTAAPGTRLALGPGAKLVVNGSLVAQGTAEAPVVLDAPEGWLGIELTGSLTGTYLQITGEGGAIRMLSGTLDLTDSVLDLRSPTLAPDCTSINGGRVTLDHVRFTACHCPIHINRADGETVVTDSVFDEAAVPVMLANLAATFTGNHFLGPGGFQDVGGGIDAEIAGNYWGGGAPTLSTTNPAQFAGADDWSASPFPDAGPR